MINPTTHAITEFTIPDGRARNRSRSRRAPTATSGSPSTAATRSVRSTRRPTSSPSSPFPRPSSDPFSIATGPDGNLWFTEYAANQIGTINPVTHGISEFAIPTATSAPGGIAAGPDGNLWFTEINTSKIGVVTPSTYLSATTEPPAFVQPGNSFGLTVSVDYSSGPVDTGYSGPVTIALVNPGTATLSGTLTVNANDGVATFTGLALNQLGTGYRLMAYTDALTTTLTTPVTVDVAPMIVSEQILYAGKGRRKHVVGFELVFSKALDPTRRRTSPITRWRRLTSCTASPARRRSH